MVQEALIIDEVGFLPKSLINHIRKNTIKGMFDL